MEMQPSGDVAEGVAAAAGGVRHVVSRTDDCEEQHMGLIGEPMTLPDAVSSKSQMAEAFPNLDSGSPGAVEPRFQCHCDGSCIRFRPAPESAVAVGGVGRPSFSPYDKRRLYCCYCIQKFKNRSHRETSEVMNVWHLAGICSHCYQLFHSPESLANHVTTVHRRPPDRERVSASSRRIAAIRMRI